MPIILSSPSMSSRHSSFESDDRPCFSASPAGRLTARSSWWKRHAAQVALLFASMALAITTLACVARGGSGELTLRASRSLDQPTGSSLSFAEESIGSSFPVSDICTFCDCSTSPPSYPASLLPARSPSSTADLGTFVRSRILATYCPHVYASDSVALDALHRSRRDPESLFAWNLQRLDPAKPTLYLFTKTSPDCSKTGIERVAYLKRHADTIARHRANVTTRGFFDGVKAEERQTIWIVVEDAELIHEGVADMLAAQDQPFIYFAFGAMPPCHVMRLLSEVVQVPQNATAMLSSMLPSRSFTASPMACSVTDLSSLRMMMQRSTRCAPVAPVYPDLVRGSVQDLLDLAWKVKKIGVWRK